MTYNSDIAEDRKEHVNEVMKKIFADTDTIGEMLDAILGAEDVRENEKIAMAFIAGEVITRQAMMSSMMKVMGSGLGEE